MFTVDKLNDNFSKEIFISKHIFKPEDYSINFLKEKTKAFCNFLKSISTVNINNNLFNHLIGGWRSEWIHIFIGEKDENSGLISKHVVIVVIKCNGECFLKDFEDPFKEEKNDFSIRIPNRPFNIIFTQGFRNSFPSPICTFFCLFFSI